MKNNVDQKIAYMCTKSITINLIALNSIECANSTIQKRILLDSWRAVQGTTAWLFGDEAFEMLAKHINTETSQDWHNYTTLAIDISNKVRFLSEKLNIQLPNYH